MKNWISIFTAALVALAVVYAFDRWTRAYQERADALATRMQRMVQIGEEMLARDDDPAKLIQFAEGRAATLKVAEWTLNEGPPFANRSSLITAVQDSRRLAEDLRARAARLERK